MVSNLQKKRINEIFKVNDIEKNKQGGQIKIGQKILIENYKKSRQIKPLQGKRFIAKSKLNGEEYNDHLNKSGCLSIFIKKYYNINSPNNYYKRNYDKKGIEVIDNYGVPVMQLDFIGKDSIFFGGAYRTESRLYILGDNGVTSYNADKMPSIDQYLKLGDNIKKIFKYPSDKNFGVRENNNR